MRLPLGRRQVGRGRRRRALQQSLQPSCAFWTSLMLRGPACCRSERERSLSAGSSRLKTVPSGRRKKAKKKKLEYFVVCMHACLACAHLAGLGCMQWLLCRQGIFCFFHGLFGRSTCGPSAPASYTALQRGCSGSGKFMAASWVERDRKTEISAEGHGCDCFVEAKSATTTTCRTTTASPAKPKMLQQCSRT